MSHKAETAFVPLNIAVPDRQRYPYPGNRYLRPVVRRPPDRGRAQPGRSRAAEG
ncbi:hypothetical protein ACPA9J_23350 [Pseudomonas aeruginosa]